MAAKEARARIKINQFLHEAGWRFFDEGKSPANIILEPGVKLTETRINALGEDFETANKGFIDFLLLDTHGKPLIVLEAKSEDKNPLVGKEQARKHARSQACRFVILSNGNLHYFWDLERGNPNIITSFPTPDSAMGYHKAQPNPQQLIEELVGSDNVVLIGFFKIENDGFGLGAQRRAIEKNELPLVKAEIEVFLGALRGRQSVNVLQPAYGLIVSKEEIAANGDYNLIGERYRENGTKAHIFPLVTIADVCAVNPRKSQMADLP